MMPPPYFHRITIAVVLIRELAQWLGPNARRQPPHHVGQLVSVQGWQQCGHSVDWLLFVYNR